MRYRPLGATGKTVSAISLRLSGEKCRGKISDWLALTHVALESGLNSFEIWAPTPALLEGFAQGIGALERRLLFVALRLTPGSGADDIFRQVEEVVSQADLDYLDLVTADGDCPLHTDALWVLEELRATPKVRLMGVCGENEEVMPHIQGGAFDVLTAPFNLLSGWRERLRVRTAVENDMSVIGWGHFPPEARDMLAAPPPRRRWFGKARNPLAGMGTYSFLHTTLGWSPEEICLGFTLTEPALATVVIEARDAAHLQLLAEVTEKDLPAAAAAQIEMARFSAERSGGRERRSA